MLTPLDIKEHAVIERWRYIDKHREQELKRAKDRFSSAYQSTLTQQIQDKTLDHDNEEILSKAYARDSAKHEAIVHLLETRQKQDRQNLERDVNDFRATYQRAEDAREYDLNDTSMSTIVYDNDSNGSQYGLGSCLHFEGEDRNKPNREKIQKEQMNRWITEQCRQKYEAIQEQQMFDQAYDFNQSMVLERLKNLETAQTMLRRQLDNDIRALNKTLANQKRYQQNVKEAFDLEDKQQEIENMNVDKILTQDPSLTISQFGPQRPLLIHWKGGMNKERRRYRTD